MGNILLYLMSSSTTLTIAYKGGTMQESEGPKLNFLPLFGRWLGVAMKAVTSDNKTHVPLNSEPIRHISDGSGFYYASAIFGQTVKNPDRITIHFWRGQQNGFLPRMAAGRMNERQPFGFSLQEYEKSPDRKQQALNLVFVSQNKPKGFEPLYLKMDVPQEKGFPKQIYLKIELQETNPEGGTIFSITAREVPESAAPEHLQKALVLQETEMPQS